MKNTSFILLVVFVLTASCNVQKKSNMSHTQTENWKTMLGAQLPLLGHRNWILIVDKAFPMQNASGIIIMNTNEDLLPVLDYTLQQIKVSPHVKAIVYTDKELNYLTPEQVPSITDYRKKLMTLLGNEDVNVLLHDSVFLQIDKAAKLFTILVLKTNETIPYSSVYLQLDCKYWSSTKETQLRESMKNKN